MAAATAVTVTQGTRQFPGLFSELFLVRATMDFGNLADAAGETNTIAVPGVALGDLVVGVSLGLDISGITVTAYVSAANVVSVRVQNESGGALDILTSTVRVIVGRAAW